jgi:hypothetical protein
LGNLTGRHWVSSGLVRRFAIILAGGIETLFWNIRVTSIAQMSELLGHFLMD